MLHAVARTVFLGEKEDGPAKKESLMTKEFEIPFPACNRERWLHNSWWAGRLAIAISSHISRQ
jgi:hypothetical protein